MHKSTTSKAARPCVPSRALTLTVTIPAKAVPMFRAVAELYETTPEDMALLATIGFIKSETVLEKMDEVLARIPAQA